MAAGRADAADAKSFAQMMAGFSQLTELEARISSGIANSKVPPKEVRKFLKNRNMNEMIHNDLIQFMCQLFAEMGLGEMILTEARTFRYQFTTAECPVCHLFPDIPGKKVCAPTSDAINRFFQENMGISASTIELRCRNMGDPACEFQVTLKPLPTYQALFDEMDDRILRSIAEKGLAKPDIVRSLGISEAELEDRLKVLQHYQLLDHRQAMTSAGDVFYKFLVQTPIKKDKDFTPPWKEMANIRDALAKSASFAEAMMEVTEETKMPWQVDDAEIVDLRERAKDKKGFAELLAAEMGGDDKEESD